MVLLYTNSHGFDRPVYPRITHSLYIRIHVIKLNRISKERKNKVQLKCWCFIGPIHASSKDHNDMYTHLPVFLCCSRKHFWILVWTRPTPKPDISRLVNLCFEFWNFPPPWVFNNHPWDRTFSRNMHLNYSRSRTSSDNISRDQFWHRKHKKNCVSNYWVIKKHCS